MHIALTGATGFLGLRLLRELLSRHPVVTALVHAGAEDPADHLARRLDAIGAPIARRGLRVVPVELAAPRLGLAADDFHDLAGELDLVVHCAGSTNLEGDLASVRAVNVAGTRRVLELAAAGRRRPPVCHISTAFVAGARRSGVVYEDELDASRGFENPYEQSKYEAELLVREWAARHRRPAVVLRPGILVDDRPPDPLLPPHPLQVVARVARAAIGPPPGPGDRFAARVVADPGAHLNFLPVDAAARRVVALAEAGPSGAVDTYHVVHERDVAIPDVLGVFERLFAVRAELVRPGTGPTLPMAGFAPYLRHRRRYDDTRARGVAGAVAAGVVDGDYLLSGLVATAVATR